MFTFRLSQKATEGLTPGQWEDKSKKRKTWGEEWPSDHSSMPRVGTTNLDWRKTKINKTQSVWKSPKKNQIVGESKQKKQENH